MTGLRHIAILKLVGTEALDMGGVLELYPINGKTFLFLDVEWKLPDVYGIHLTRGGRILYTLCTDTCGKHYFGYSKSTDSVPLST